MSDATRALLLRLARGDDEAWPEFLQVFAPLLLQVAREIERDPDAASDAFLFICEHLAAGRFQRLRKFDIGGVATFPTWLRTVAWNLALDAGRHRRGRFRPLAAIRRLPILQQRVFRLRYEERLPLDQAVALLQPEFPGLSHRAASQAEADVDRVVDSRQRWLIATRHPAVESLDVPEPDGDRRAVDPPAAGQDPEWAAIARQARVRLERELEALSSEDRALLRLRYEEGLTLASLARVSGLKDQWAADRRVREVLRRLRAALDARPDRGSV